MTKEQKAAYVQAQSVCAVAELQAMIAENNERAMRDLAPAYSPEQFRAVIDQYGISHNAIITLFNNPDY